MIDKVKNFVRPLFSKSMINSWHLWNAKLAAVYYGFPGRKLKVVGITGTNGKTTVAYLAHAMLNAAQLKTSMATTVSLAIGNKYERNNRKMTTLSPWTLQRFLKKSLELGCNHAVLEVTSHAIAQHRVWGINFDTVVFTNLTHDHLDYHKDLNSYRNEKLKLFQNHPRVLISNLDDNSGHLFLSQSAKHKLSYSVDGKADIIARKIYQEATHSLLTVIVPEGQFAVKFPMPGKYNISNLLAAIGVAIGYNINFETISETVNNFKGVPGRMEQVRLGQDFDVIIDYAHTPDALDKVFSALNSSSHGKIIHVFGATGARDKTKRPILGAISARNADISIITNEDPYHENPLSIMEAIKKGIKTSNYELKMINDESNYNLKNSNLRIESSFRYRHSSLSKQPKVLNESLFMIEDRREAIAKALSLASKRDIVLITGKGHEQVMAVADPSGGPEGFRLVPWNERKIVEEELGKLT